MDLEETGRSTANWGLPTGTVEAQSNLSERQFRRVASISSFTESEIKVIDHLFRHGDDGLGNAPTLSLEESRELKLCIQYRINIHICINLINKCPNVLVQYQVPSQSPDPILAIGR